MNFCPKKNKLNLGIFYEPWSKVTLTVNAQTNYSDKNASMRLEVVLLDKNDNAPKFLSPPEEIKIPEKLEDSFLTPLFNFTVHDADVGENARIKFRLTDCPACGFEKKRKFYTSLHCARLMEAFV